MRKFLIVSALLFSVSSIATMTLRFTHEGETPYIVEATFNGSEADKTLGTVAADVALGESVQICNGSFSLNLAESKLSINFKSEDDAENVCAKDNLVVDLSSAQYMQVMTGLPSEVTFRSARFDNQPKTATVVMINH